LVDLQSALFFSFSLTTKLLTMKIITPNTTQKKHLEEVKEDMQELGPPVIRMVDRDKHLVAIEGSHRVNAAKDLDIPIHVKLVDPEGFTQNHDFKDLPKKIRVGELARNVEMAPQSSVNIPDKNLKFV
jgi:hypothetical protein